MHTHAHTAAHAHTCTSLHTYTHKCIHTGTYTHTNAYIQAHTHKCIYTGTYTDSHTTAHIYEHKHIYAHISTYTRAPEYTHAIADKSESHPTHTPDLYRSVIHRVPLSPHTYPHSPGHSEPLAASLCTTRDPEAHKKRSERKLCFKCAQAFFIKKRLGTPET